MPSSFRPPFKAALLGLLIAAAPCLSHGQTAAASKSDLPYKEGATSLSDYETTRCKLDLYTPTGAGEPLPVIV